jgi:hypothetical protein
LQTPGKAGIAETKAVQFVPEPFGGGDNARIMSLLLHSNLLNYFFLSD